MTRQSSREPRRACQAGQARQTPEPYLFVSRTPDGRLRTERFSTAAEYHRRLATPGAQAQPISIDDLINVLDA